MLFALLLFSGISNLALAQYESVNPRWDRGSAMAAVQSVDIEVAINEIEDLNDLEAIEKRDDWPMPAREAAIYKYTRSLTALPRDAVSVDVMQYLRSYQTRVLVPHEDHGEALVPLFNIRGAASGVENTWVRAESTAKAKKVLEQNPTALVAKYLQSGNPVQQSGYRDALATAPDTELWVLQAIAMDQLEKSPDLTSLLATTAAITADPAATRRLLTHGSGSGLSTTFESIASMADPLVTVDLLAFAIEQAPAGNAALAIAAWWPVVRHNAAARQLLLDKLDDPTLGSAIALALARQPDTQTIRELQLVASGDSLAARRAQLALNMSRDGLLVEVQK
jgi:hypothetical protein